MRLGYYFKFPDGCTDATDFAHCRGACPLLDYRIDDLADWQVYKVLDTGDILTALADFMLGTDPFTGKYVVDGLDYNGSITFYRWFIPVLCGPGKMAPYATPLAATNDPIFWVSHSSYERIWAWARLRADHAEGQGAAVNASSSFHDSWNTNNSTCAGHNFHDTVRCCRGSSAVLPRFFRGSAVPLFRASRCSPVL